MNQTEKRGVYKCKPCLDKNQKVLEKKKEEGRVKKRNVSHLLADFALINILSLGFHIWKMGRIMSTQEVCGEVYITGEYLEVWPLGFKS